MRTFTDLTCLLLLRADTTCGLDIDHICDGHRSEGRTTSLNDGMAMNDDHDVPQLPTDTLQLLQEFNAEKDDRARQFDDLKSRSEDTFQNKLTMDLFGEDW